MKRLLSAILAFSLLLAGCQAGREQHSSAGAKEQASTASSDAGASEEDPAFAGQASEVGEALLQGFVQIYEDACGGEELSPSRPPSREQMTAFTLGWMRRGGLLEQYAIYTGSQVVGYLLPEMDTAGLCAAWFGEDAASRVSFAGLRVEADEPDPEASITLTLTSCEPDGQGGWMLTVARERGGRELRPALYTFAPSMPPKEGAGLLAGFDQELWRVVSVQNLPMPAREGGGDIIKIGTPGELEQFANLIAGGDWQYSDNVYQLSADLDMTGWVIAPIGYTPVDHRDPAPGYLSTTFDGQNHTIKNLTIDGQGAYTGLFAAVGKNGFVSNLTLENVQVTGNLDSAASSTGGIAGVVHNGAINRCRVSGAVTGLSNVGGIAGRVLGGNLQGCRSDADVVGHYNVGGFAGALIGGETHVIDCTAAGTLVLDQAGSQAGGFTGLASGASIDRAIVSVRMQIAPDTGRVGSFLGGMEGYEGASAGRIVGCFYDTDAAPGLPEVGSAERPLETSALLGMSGAQLIAMGAI